MIRFKSKTKTLFSSIISLLLCISMLFGEVAVLTASDTSGSEETVKVTLLKHNGSEYVDVSNNIDGETVRGEKSIWDGDILWYPGKTEVVFLQVENSGSVSVDYDVLLKVTANTLGTNINPADAFSYAVLADMTAEEFAEASLNTWVQIQNAAEKTEGLFTDSESQEIKTGSLEVDETSSFAFAIHMDEAAGSEYMNGSISFDMEVVGTSNVQPITPAPTPNPTRGDILDDAGDFENMDYTIGTDTDWRWRKTKSSDYSGSAKLVDDERKMSPAKGKYLTIEAIDNDGNGSLDQPVLQYKNYPRLIEGDTTYILDMYIRRNSEHYPEIVLYDRIKDEAAREIVILTTESGKENSITAEPDEDGWQHVTYEFTTQANATKLQMMIYGGKSVADAADWSFDIDGISIVPKPESYDTSDSRLKDILQGDGNFEEGVTIDVKGITATWNRTGKNYVGAIAKIVDVEDAPNGDSCLYLEKTADTPEPSIMYKNSPYIIESGQTYILELYVKRMSEEAVPFVQLYERKDDGDFGLIRTIKLLETGSELTENIGEWVKIQKEFTAGTQVEGANRLRLDIRGLTTDGTSCYIDGVRIMGPKTEAELAKDAFEDKLEAENATSMQVIQDDGDPTVRKEAIDGVDNLLLNGDFDTDTSHWTPNKYSRESYAWSGGGTGGIGLDTEIGREGAPSVEADGCMKLLPNATRSPSIKQYVYNMEGGAEYQLTFNYKIDEGSNAVPAPQIECFANTTEPGDTGHMGDLEFNRVETHFYNDGLWHSYTYRVRVPERTDYVEVFVCQLGGSDGAVYFDDVTFCKTGTATVISLNSDMKFFYTDMQDESKTLTATVQTDIFPEYADGNVVFRVYDGQTEVWASAPTALSNSTATVDLPLSKLTKTDTPYCVKATLYDDNTEKAAASRNIFMYERPSALDENGNYIKFGADFIPVMGYHVYNNETVQHFDVVGEAGINVVPISIGLSADQVVAALDSLHELGLKGTVSLYYKPVGESHMLPAGHEKNMAQTIEVVSDERVRNHPAMFGYNIADEPFIHQLDPRQDLENSYRLIRQYDTENVITFVEDIEYLIKESSSFADALIVDPYYAAAGASIYSIVKQAKEDLNYAKPLWGLFQTYIHHTAYFNTPDDVRNNNYQALIAGVNGYGYFSVSDAGNVSYTYLDKLDDWKDLSWPTSEGYIPLWEVKTPDNAGAGAEVWEGLKSFAAVEVPIINAYFGAGEGTKTAEEINIEDGYIYHGWTAEDSTDYLVVLNVKGEDVHVDIPVSGESAKIVAGREDTQLYGVKDGKLSLDLVNVEALLLEMTDITVSEYELGTGEDISLEVDAEALDEVSVKATDSSEDFTPLEADKDYTIDANAGTLTFTQSYLEALLPGAYDVKLTYGDAHVEAVLKIAAEELSTVPEKSDLNYQKGDAEGAKIYCTGAFSRFRGIKKDGVEVDIANYTAKEGSTVITFTKAYMETLSDGEHVFELVFRDGSINATVQVTAVEDDTNEDSEASDDTSEDSNTSDGTTEDNNTSDDTTEDNNSSENTTADDNTSEEETDNSDAEDDTAGTAPTVNAGGSATATGDSSHIGLWIALLAVAAMIGMYVTFIKKRSIK